MKTISSLAKFHQFEGLNREKDVNEVRPGDVVLIQSDYLTNEWKFTEHLVIDVWRSDYSAQMTLLNPHGYTFVWVIR